MNFSSVLRCGFLDLRINESIRFSLILLFLNTTCSHITNFDVLNRNLYLVYSCDERFSRNEFLFSCCILRSGQVNGGINTILVSTVQFMKIT